MDSDDAEGAELPPVDAKNIAGAGTKRRVDRAHDPTRLNRGVRVAGASAAALAGAALPPFDAEETKMSGAGKKRRVERAQSDRRRRHLAVTFAPDTVLDDGGWRLQEALKRKRERRGFQMAPAERAVLDSEMSAANELQLRLHVLRAAVATRQEARMLFDRPITGHGQRPGGAGFQASSYMYQAPNKEPKSPWASKSGTPAGATQRRVAAKKARKPRQADVAAMKKEGARSRKVREEEGVATANTHGETNGAAATYVTPPRPRPPHTHTYPPAFPSVVPALLLCRHQPPVRRYCACFVVRVVVVGPGLLLVGRGGQYRLVTLSPRHHSHPRLRSRGVFW